MQHNYFSQILDLVVQIMLKNLSKYCVIDGDDAAKKERHG